MKRAPHVLLAASLPGLFLLLASSCTVSRPAPPAPDSLRWWKGNTHAHTLWSDGTSAPEQAVLWYRDHGYNFVVLSEHDTLMRGERWVRVSDDRGPLTSLAVDRLVAGFGAENVALREREGGREMRLATLDELRGRFETAGQFLLIHGEEVTASFGLTPVHVNGLNLLEPIAPIQADDIQGTLDRNVQAILGQGARDARPVVAQVNHPNYKWALSWQNVAHAPAGAVFEVYNGHPRAQNRGDDEHPDTGVIWDHALTFRLTSVGGSLLYGVASDDAHDFPPDPPGDATPGRGWVFVHARELTAGAIVAALERGDFYSSSGVTLADVASDGKRYRLELREDAGVQYTTRFIGTRLIGGRPAVIGEVLLETHSNPAEYVFRGDELYVRAVVSSSRAHRNPGAPGDVEMAWVQPVRPASAPARR